MPGPTTTSQSISAFDPRSIAGCQLWLDSLDTSSLTGSSPVTAWRDKSPNATNATYSSSPALTSSAINGRQAILLNGSSSFTGTSTGSGTTLTVCIVGTQSSGCATNGGLVCLGRSGYADWNDIGSLAITQISSGNMVSTRTSNSQTVNTGTATPFIYILIFDGTYVNTYYNGTLQTTANISSSGTFAYTNYVIGNRAGNTGNYFWTGYIGEVIIYNSALISSQRQAIEGYLSWKWAFNTISTKIFSKTHAFYSIIPFLRFFNPIDIGIPEYWFDAADTSTITTSSTYLTTWTNKGSFTGSNITPTTANTATSGLLKYNGNNLITIPITQYLQFSGYFPNSARTRFVVTRPTSTGNCIFMFQNGTPGYGVDYIAIESSTLIEVAQGSIVNTQSSSISSQNGLMALFTFFNSSTASGNNRSALNGSNISLTTSYAASSYYGAAITTYVGWSSGTGQDIAEFISFNSELSLQQIYMVEGYLSWKWGIQSYMPSSHSFSKFPSSSTVPFSPISVPNCILWLDPSNQNNLTLSGTNVISITDSSSSGNNATQYAGSVYATAVTVGGNTMLSFPGANIVYRSAMVLTGSAYTIFVVMSLLSTTGNGSGYQRAINTDNSSGGKIFLGALNGNLATFTGNNGFNDVNQNSPTYALVGSGLQIVTMYVNGSSLIPYINGTAETAKTGTTGATTVLDIGCYQDSTTQAWNGYIGDIIVYSSALSTYQRQQVEGYLAWKWNVRLASTHPYYKIIPSQSYTS